MNKPLSSQQYWIGVGLVAALGAGLGVSGWLLHAAAQGALSFPGSYLEAIYRTLLFFAAEAPAEKVPVDNYLLQSARLIAPAATSAVAIKVVLSVLSGSIQRWRAENRTGHTIVVGDTPNARAFAKSEAAEGRKVVLLSSSGDSVPPSEGAEPILSYADDPLDPAVLKRLGIQRSERLILATGHDGDNLEIALAARRVVMASQSSGEMVRAYASVSDRRLWRQLTASDAIDRNDEGFELIPFNLPSWAARRFHWEEPLLDYVQIRGQSRLHCVFIGFDDYAEALIGQLPPANVFPGLEIPLFSILTTDKAGTETLLARSFPNLASVAAVTVRHFDANRTPLDEELMQRVEEDGGVTAVFVCLPTDEEALELAVYVRESMKRHACWLAPVYPRLTKCEGLGDLLQDSRTTTNFESVIQPFGVEDRTCAVSALDGSLEDFAGMFHEDYRKARLEAEKTKDDDNQHRTLSIWAKLNETYKAANRRAADHVPTKLLAAGFTREPGFTLVAPKSFNLTPSSEALEALAKLEHDSWNAERYIDGWRYGAQRDDDRRIHNCLVPYDALSDTMKQFDRAQIEIIERNIIDREKSGTVATIMPDFWIGISMSTDEPEPIRADVVRRLKNAAQREDSGTNFTLVSAFTSATEVEIILELSREFRRSDTPHRVLSISSRSHREVEQFRNRLFGGSNIQWIFNVEEKQYQENFGIEDYLIARCDFVLFDTENRPYHRNTDQFPERAARFKSRFLGSIPSASAD